MSQEILIITSQKESKKLPLEQKIHIIGRSSSADIRIDDPNASRKHASMERKVDGWHVSDLGSTNGTFVDGKKIHSFMLSPGKVFTIGNTSFMLDPGKASIQSLTTGSSGKTREKKGFSLKTTAAVVIVVLITLISFLVLKERGGEKTVKKTEAVSVVPINPVVIPATGSKSSGNKMTEHSVEMNKQSSSLSMEYYRQGLLFYENGNLKKAVEKWDMALAQDRDNRLARKKLAKALRKLDEEVEKHYQAGLMHLKYMRFREAEQELTIVVELSRDKSDRRYLDAINKLNQLKTK